MRRPALAISFSFFVLLEPACGQEPTPTPTLSGADYIAYAEKLIERTRQEQPDIASRADELYKRLPAIVDQLEAEARAAGRPSSSLGLQTGSPRIEAEMERWIGEKSANIDTEIRFATGRLKTIEQAMQPIKSLIEERQRKQQIISSVILLIKDLLAGEDGTPEAPENDRNKSDRVGPSASNME
jgi:hypothetical protein